MSGPVGAVAPPLLLHSKVLWRVCKELIHYCEEGAKEKKERKKKKKRSHMSVSVQIFCCFCLGLPHWGVRTLVQAMGETQKVVASGVWSAESHKTVYNSEMFSYSEGVLFLVSSCQLLRWWSRSPLFLFKLSLPSSSLRRQNEQGLEWAKAIVTNNAQLRVRNPRSLSNQSGAGFQNGVGIIWRKKNFLPILGGALPQTHKCVAKLSFCIMLDL